MEHPEILAGFALTLSIALAIASVATGPPKRPLRGWLGDFFVRWGLAGLLVWFVVHGFWAVREVLGQKLVIPFTPLEGYLEHATVWSAVATGLATFLFFGAALLLGAIFAREELPQGVVYYRQVVIAVATEELKQEKEKAVLVASRRGREKRL